MIANEFIKGLGPKLLNKHIDSIGVFYLLMFFVTGRICMVAVYVDL